MSLNQTLINSREILNEARAWLPAVFIGPAPVDDTRGPPQFAPGNQVRIFNTQIEKVNRALATSMAELDVPYLDLFTPLMGALRWHDLMKLGDGVHPTARGYDLIDQTIEQWPAWCAL